MNRQPTPEERAHAGYIECRGVENFDPWIADGWHHFERTAWKVIGRGNWSPRAPQMVKVRNRLESGPATTGELSDLTGEDSAYISGALYQAKRKGHVRQRKIRRHDGGGRNGNPNTSVWSLA